MKTDAMKPADIVFKNAAIYTVDKERNWAEAVAITDGKIVYVGDNEDVKSFIGERTEVIDLEGQMVLPGFFDAHAHPIMQAFFSTGVMINFEADYDEVLETIKKYIIENPDRNAYFGVGYSEDLFGDVGPKKEDLDEICSDIPIFIMSSGCHSGWSNSKAFELAGVDRNHSDPIPSFQYYKRDSEGNPTGGVVEWGPIGEIINAINPFVKEEVQAEYEHIFKELNSAGITGIWDAGVATWLSDIAFPIYEEFNKLGKLPLRTVGCYFVTTKDEIPNAIDELKKLSNIYDDDMFRINTFKVLNDGTVEDRSACLFEDYSDGSGNGQMLLSGQEFYDLCVAAAKEGFDIHIHGIGDKTIYENLMAAKAVRESGYHDIRFTNAHTEYVRKEDRELFAKYNVIANTTGVWFVHWEGNETALGDRSKQLFTMKTFIDSGTKVTFSSDYPASELGLEPLKSIQMAVTRQYYAEKNYPVLEPVEERLTIEEVIEAYTINPAYQIRMEDKLGSIEVGKYADLVVLGENIFEVDTYSIHNIPVVMTITNGKIVYHANAID